MAGRILIGLAALAAGLIRQLARDDAETSTNTAQPPGRAATPKKIGYRPGSIGDISSQIGYDVRDLIVAGYSHQQIYRVVDGEITLEQLLRLKPENKRR